MLEFVLAVFSVICVAGTAVFVVVLKVMAAKKPPAPKPRPYV